MVFKATMLTVQDNQVWGEVGCMQNVCSYSTYRVCFLFIVVKVAIEDFYKQLHLRSGVHALVTDSNSFL